MPASEGESSELQLGIRQVYRLILTGVMFKQRFVQSVPRSKHCPSLL